MSSRHVEWVNENTQRAYPLADDRGGDLPTTLIGDMHISAPLEAGDVWLQYVRVTAQLVTLSVSSDVGVLGSCTLARADAVPFSTHPLEPLGTYGGGWVTLGQLPSDDLEMKFTAATGLLADNAVRRMPDWPVRSLRLLGYTHAALSGIPRVVSSDTVTVTRNGAEIQLSLADPASAENFLGPCESEARKCVVPPMRRINGVCADADGLLTIIIRKRDRGAG